MECGDFVGLKVNTVSNEDVMDNALRVYTSS